MIRIGCSGWSYAHWRNVLYPASGTTASWLSVYAESFDTVEINSTFYRLPRAEVVLPLASRRSRRPLGGVDPGDVLLRREREPILDTREALARGRGWSCTAGRAHCAAARRGEARARAFAAARSLPARRRAPGIRAVSVVAWGRHAFEFRHASWFDDEAYALLRKHDAALVVADRAPDPPTPWVDMAGWVYVRFHFGRGHNGNYSARELRAWAERISRAPDDVYAYFNNDWEGFAIENARALRSFVGTDLELAR